MTVDALTKCDLAKGNAAQMQMLKTGLLRLSREQDSLAARRAMPSVRDRGRVASLRQLSQS
eukprot:6912283-Pyramimonas_sp.AAC.1